MALPLLGLIGTAARAAAPAVMRAVGPTFTRAATTLTRRPPVRPVSPVAAPRPVAPTVAQRPSLIVPGARPVGPTPQLLTAAPRVGTVRPVAPQPSAPFGTPARLREPIAPAAQAAQAAPQAAAPALRQLVEEAAAPAAAAARTGFLRGGLSSIPRGARIAAATGAALAPTIVSGAERYLDFARGLEPGTTQAPEWVDRAAAAAQLAGFALPFGAAASRAIPATRRFRDVAGALGFGGGLAAIGPEAVRTLTGTRADVAEADQVAPVEEPVAAPAAPAVEMPSQMEQVQQMQEEALLAYEQQLVQEDQALDALYQQAIDEAIAARGATTQADLAADPLLQQELAAINQQYTSAKQNIQDNYAAALNQVQGYQTQADQMMQELAAAQLAGIETAAGQAMAPAPGTGLSAEEAAAAGLSQTAVGGAGTTGAALLGGMGGVTSAQLAAQRVAAGSLLAEQLASGRLDQAAVETALEQALVDAERGARVTAAERQAREREVRRQQNIEAADMRLRAAESRRAETASKREAIAAARLQNNQRLADRIAGMSAEEYRRFVGGDVTTVSPAWAKSRISPPAKGTGESTGVVPGFPAASVDDANTVLQLFETEMGNILATNQDRATAINSIARWIIDVTNTYGVDARAVLRAAGHPVTPEEIYNKLAPQR